MSLPASTHTSCPLCRVAKATAVTVTPVHLAEDQGERFEWVACSGCGLVRLANPPVGNALDAYYGPDYLPHAGPEAWGPWAPLATFGSRRMDRRRVRLALKALGSRPGTGDDAIGPSGVRLSDTDIRVLDVGCGRPTFLRALANQTGWEGTGLDTTDAGWAGDAPGEWEGLSLHTGDPVTADLPGEAYHLVTLWHVLEHLPHPTETLVRLRDRAIPGGRLLIEVPDFASIPRRLQGENWIGYDSPRHTVAFDPDTLRRTLEESGWEVLEIRQGGTMDPWVLWWLGAQAKKRRSLADRLSREIPAFLLGMALTSPIAALQRWIPLGAMTALARKP